MDPQARSDACPGDDVLRAFARGDLPLAAIEAVGRHQETCADCEARARRIDAEADAVVDELRRAVTARHEGPDGDASPPELPDYEIDPVPIGSGATGVVYRARHRKLGRVVALKMIARRPDVVSRLFEMEAKAVAQLHHPNIVQIYDIGRHDDRPFLALELVGDGSLEDRLAEGPLDPKRAAETLRSLAGAVDHAHRQGIVHCDLKPGNILLGRDGTPKIADFGVAQWVESDGYWDEAGGFPGTPRYMAPEQAEGGASVGPATDVYSLGLILREMLAGRLPEGGPAPPGSAPPGVPEELDRIAARCTRTRPEDRYPTAAALADDLSRYLTDEPAGPADGGFRRRPAGPWAKALVASGLASVSVIAALSRPEGGPMETAADSWATKPAEADPARKTVIQEDGSIRLGAAAAEVKGDSLRFEASFGNLGYWHGPRDRASWTFQVEEAGTYGLSLEYANRNGEAGNRFVLRVDGRTFHGEARGTGGWSEYRIFPVARVRLEAGEHRLDVGPAGPLDGALFDLRAVILAPEES